MKYTARNPAENLLDNPLELPDSGGLILRPGRSVADVPAKCFEHPMIKHLIEEGQIVKSSKKGETKEPTPEKKPQSNSGAKDKGNTSS